MKIKLSIVVILICSSLAFLVVSSSSKSSQLHLKLPEYKVKLTNDLKAITSNEITIYGTVKEGSIRKFNGVQAEFIVEDKAIKGFEVEVYFTGKTLLPDTFKDGSMASVTGRYNEDKKKFVADKVLAKCSSKYDSSDEYKSKKDYKSMLPKDSKKQQVY